MTSAPEAHKTAGVLIDRDRLVFIIASNLDCTAEVASITGIGEAADEILAEIEDALLFSTPSVPAVAELSGDGLPLPAASGAAAEERKGPLLHRELWDAIIDEKLAGDGPIQGRDLPDRLYAALATRAVEPLVFRMEDKGRLRAGTELGLHYIIERKDDGWYLHGSLVAGRFDTQEEAVFAAQSDFARCVLTYVVSLPLPAASGAASGWMPKEIPEDIDTLAIEACRHFHMDVIPEAFREGLAYRAIVLAITWDRASSSGLPRGVAGAAELASLQTENRKLKADLRSYEIDFNMMHETAAERDVLAERRRQIAEEGWTPEHDDEHDLGQLGLAAALYAIPYETVIGGEPMLAQDTFIGLDMALEIVGGWNLKPETDTRRRKVKAAALLHAEIERLDRKEAGNGVS